MVGKAWLANKDRPSATGCSSGPTSPLAAAQRPLQCGQPAKLGNKDLFYLLRLLNHGHSCLLGEKSGGSTFHGRSQECCRLSSQCSHTCFNVLYGNGDAQQVQPLQADVCTNHAHTFASLNSLLGHRAGSQQTLFPL